MRIPPLTYLFLIPRSFVCRKTLWVRSPQPLSVSGSARAVLVSSAHSRALTPGLRLRVGKRVP